jgi:hypothetical protein
MRDVMVDIESLGVRPGSVIRSVGAIFFDPHTGQLGPEFYANVDRVDCEANGLTVDKSTVAWWERQSKAAQDALLVNPQSLYDALWSFTTWWQTNGGERVWSHGANFDQPILDACYVAIGMQSPWSFWNSRCTRTLFDIAGVDAHKMSAGEVKHNALDDARIQARAVNVCFQRLGKSSITAAPPPVVVPASEGAFG